MEKRTSEDYAEKRMTDTTRLANLLIGANAKTAQKVWREAERLGIGDQVRRAWLDKLAERPVDKP